MLILQTGDNALKGVCLMELHVGIAVAVFNADDKSSDLASRLSIEGIAGLMLYSPQNWLPMPADTYCGKPFAESGMKPHDLSDLQRKFLIDDNVYDFAFGLNWSGTIDDERTMRYR